MAHFRSMALSIYFELTCIYYQFVLGTNMFLATCLYFLNKLRHATLWLCVMYVGTYFMLFYFLV